MSNFYTTASPAASTVRDWRDYTTTALATVLLALFWWLAVSASLEHSQTSDEMPHIGAGYAYNRFGDYRMQPENGNLPQRLFGLAPWIDRAPFPMEPELWRRSAYWVLCWEFLYGPNALTDWFLLSARALNALFGVALGGLVFGLARAWHGRAAGLLALGFYVFAPNFLAHSGLATSDLAGTFFLTLAPWLFWRHLEHRTVGSGALAALATGLAFVAKHNAVLLAPIYVVLVLLDAWLRAPLGGRLPHGVRGVGLGVVQALAALAITWAFYGFRFSARGPDTPELTQFIVTWDDLYRTLGTSRHVIAWAVDWKILPEAWLYGLAHVMSGASGRPAFFAGEHSLHGWWQFFPTLFLTKTTLGMLGALALAGTIAVLHARRATAAVRQHWLTRYAPLLVTTAIAGLTALTSKINIGDRHILPVYPMLCVMLGVLMTRRWIAVAGGALLVAHGWASLAIRPHYLASFNVLAGGPEQAYRLVVDSSLDWGQDLPTLQKWVTANRQPKEPFYLGYFGNAWPPHYGVRPTVFLNPRSYVVGPPHVRHELQPGLYAVSATVLEEALTRYRGPWTAANEVDYRGLRARFAGEPTSAPVTDDYARYDALRFARLCKFLQRRPPDAFAGYSILLFRLRAEELRAALEGPVISLHRLRIP